MVLMALICTAQNKSKSSSNVYALQTEIIITDEDDNVIGEDS